MRNGPAEPDSFSVEPREMRLVLADVTHVLACAGVPDPQREARWLLTAALAIPAAHFISHPDQIIEAGELSRVLDWTERRSRREPLWRIAGMRSFYGREFELSANTLEPRPDSEAVVEAALELVRARFSPLAPLRLLDIGTGTGCLLITLLAELPRARGLGTDISRDALQTAAVNARRHGVDERAGWLQARSLCGIEGPYDLLISNPPYIPSADLRALEPEVRDYDPVAALDGGRDGLDIYRELAKDVRRVVPDGLVVLEVGAGQSGQVLGLLEKAYFEDTTFETRTFRDLGGNVRCVTLSAHG